MTDDYIDRIIAAQTAETNRVISAASIGYAAAAGSAGTAVTNNFVQTAADLSDGSGRGNESNALPPIELHASVELDGDVIGETVMQYLDRRSRITNGAE